MEVITFIIVSILLLPLFIRWHRIGVERYEYYDRLAFWESLSEEDKESADWFMEGKL